MQGQADVETCLVEQCTYNCREECCAPDIQVGGDHPLCDTFTTGEVQPTDTMASVGGCDVTQCHFNDSMDCMAAGITVSNHAGHADCLTFRQ